MHRIMLTTALVIGAAAWPAGAYATTDLRSPDTRDAAATAAEVAPPQDLRSPDARDAAAGGGTSVRAEETGASPSRPVATVSDGFEWGDAGIGAAVMFALLSLGGGALLLTGNSRRAPTT